MGTRSYDGSTCYKWIRDQYATEKSDMKNGPDCESELKAVESTKDETGLDLEVNKGIKARKIVMEDGKIIYALPTIEIPYQKLSKTLKQILLIDPIWMISLSATKDNR